MTKYPRPDGLVEDERRGTERRSHQASVPAMMAALCDEQRRVGTDRRAPKNSTLTAEQIELLISQFALLASQAEWKPESMRKIAQLRVMALRSLGARDGERYRFLRDFLNPDDYYSKWPRWVVACESAGTGEVLCGEKLDRAIDAALSARPSGEEK